jgi:protein-S-isoprenylcysteine O-methyltransferase Ste14
MTAGPTARLIALRRLLVPDSLSQPDEFSMADFQAIRRIVVTTLFIAMACLLAFGGSLLGAPAQQWLRIGGAALIAAGIVGRLWSIVHIGGRKSLEVVQTGPYSVTRNPLYVSSTVAAAGIGAQAGSVTAALLAGLLCAAAFQFVIRFEENYLVCELGEAYRDYMRRVPRFWPSPSLYRDPDTLCVDPRILRRTLRDGVLLLAAIPFFGLIGAAQQAGLLPVLFRFW